MASSTTSCFGRAIGQRHVLADLETELEVDAALGQALGAALDDVLLQLEAGNAVDQQAAGPVVPVIDGDLIAGGAQLLGGRQAGRAGADRRRRSRRARQRAGSASPSRSRRPDR
jgi:hypothetical protein